MTFPQTPKSKMARYIIWRRVFADIPLNSGYLTAIKPYHNWGRREDAHLFTLKQAQKLTFSYNRRPRAGWDIPDGREPRDGYEVWGYTRAN